MPFTRVQDIILNRQKSIKNIKVMHKTILVINIALLLKSLHQLLIRLVEHDHQQWAVRMIDKQSHMHMCQELQTQVDWIKILNIKRIYRWSNTAAQLGSSNNSAQTNHQWQFQHSVWLSLLPKWWVKHQVTTPAENTHQTQKWTVA